MKYLNTDSIPQTYNLFFDIDISKDTLDGYNEIFLNVIKQTDIIQFHTLDLDIKDIIFDDMKIEKSNIIYDLDEQMCTAQLNEKINIGDHKLIIHFDKKFDKGRGVLSRLSRYNEHNKIIYTEFEPNLARSCFPCWDEPQIKVVYEMKIRINDNKYQILFNTDPVNVTKYDNKVTYIFEKTVPMSTYIMSFIVCDYKYIEKYTNSNVRLRVYIPKCELNNDVGKFALDFGVKCMDMMNEYFQQPYPLTKMDFVPIDELDSGGMENYGLIFYPLKSLLVSKLKSTIDNKITIAEVIAHELVHQWFGNMLTISSWKEIWLKESFAKFFGYYFIEKILTSCDIKSLFVMENFKTYELDSISSKSIKIKNISDNKHILQIYDPIVYNKGATLLLELLDYLGEDEFKSIIRKYIDKYKFSVITTESFLDIISSNVDPSCADSIGKMIYSFIETKGIPIINFNNNNVKVSSLNICHLINKKINNRQYLCSTTDIIIPIKIGDNKFLCQNNLKLNTLNMITNDKYTQYCMICYDDAQYKLLINNINVMKPHQHLSVIYDLYTLGLCSLSQFKYLVRYINKLITIMMEYTTRSQFNCYLMSYVHEIIENIKKFRLNDVYYKQYLYDPYDDLINKMTKIFNIAYDSILNEITDDQINENKLILFLLKFKCGKNSNIIRSLVRNKRFDISKDINNVIFMYIFKYNLFNDYHDFVNIMRDFPFLVDTIISSLKFSSNKVIIDQLFDNIVTLPYRKVTDILKTNEYFLQQYTKQFINNYDKYVKINQLGTFGFDKILCELITNQTDDILIDQLFNKLNNVDNNSFAVKMKHYKNILFCRLYKNINFKNFVK
jgi:hypothetical protein